MKTPWSNTLAAFLDTFIFFGVAFYQSSDPFMSEHWVQIALSDYGFKLLIGLGLFLPAYGFLLKILIQCMTLSSSLHTLNEKVAK